MIKQSELEVMVCDLFVDAYRAGISGSDHNYGAARGDRAKLIEKIGELFDEIETMQNRHKHEISELNQELEDERHHYSYLLSSCYVELEERRKHTEPDAESDYIPDDGDKFSEQNLPFPDVDDLAPASELLGGDE